MISRKWDFRFMQLCDVVAGWSKDTSTKVGAVIIDNEKNIKSLGFNGFPRGVDDTVKERYERPQKYQWTEHAERNAVFNATRNGTVLYNCILYLNQGIPCTGCARAIIQSGISTVKCRKKDYESGEHEKRWKEEAEISKTLFKEAGVDLIELEM